jgi:hypothetical protein
VLTTLLQLIPLAIASAAAPLPILIAIGMQETKRPIANSIAYLLGGLLVYVVLITLGAAVLAKVSSLHKGHSPSELALWIMIILGAGLLLFAVLIVSSGRQVKVPDRVDRVIGSVGPAGAFAIGMAILSPGWKNIALLLAALNIVGSADLGTANNWIALIVYLAITIAPATVPLAIYLTLPRERAAAMTRSWRRWIEEHAITAIISVAIIIGLGLVLRGAYGLVA